MKKTEENTENLFGDLKKELPFRVPEGYFENFADRLKVRIAEEEYAGKKRSLLYYLKPALAVAASLVLVMLLINIPVRKYIPADNGYMAQKQLMSDSADSTGNFPLTLISYFSDDQFLSAISDMNEDDNIILSSENLADYITANYNDYEIIANN